MNLHISAFIDPASMTKQSDLNPSEKSKIPIKYKHVCMSHVFLTVQMVPNRATGRGEGGRGGIDI